MIRVVLADDHAVVRRGLKAMIDHETDMCVVGESGDGTAVVETLRRTPCDVLVLDVSMPGQSGLDVLRRVRKELTGVKVVVLTMYAEDQFALHMLHAGAKAYLNKSRAPEEVLAAIRSAARGRPYVTQKLEDLALMSQNEGESEPHEQLTAREYQVFLLLAEGCTVGETAVQLALSISTVSNHIAGIRRKLDAGSVGDIVRYAHRIGLTER